MTFYQSDFLIGMTCWCSRKGSWTVELPTQTENTNCQHMGFWYVIFSLCTGLKLLDNWWRKSVADYTCSVCSLLYNPDMPLHSVSVLPYVGIDSVSIYTTCTIHLHRSVCLFDCYGKCCI